MSQYTHLSTPDPEFQALYQEKLKTVQDAVSTQVTVEVAPGDPIAAMRKEARHSWVAEADKAYGHLVPSGESYVNRSFT